MTTSEKTIVPAALRGARLLSLGLFPVLVVACGHRARLPVAAGIGPNPALPAPRSSLIPTMKGAPAKRWADGQTPTPGTGLSVTAFARGLDHPRWLYVLPNGDVLVAETNGPPRPEDSKGIRGFFTRRFEKRTGALVPSANRITLLRDADGDGVAEIRSPLLTGLSSPFGMTLIGDALYVANTDALVRYAYTAGMLRVATPPTIVLALPAGPLNHHWTKNVIASPDQSKLYVAIGSNSNAGEHGIAKETDRATIWEVDVRTGTHRAFATGLRNPVGMAFAPGSGVLWTSVNERDELGGDLVPDYMTSVRDGAFYGFPYSYFGAHVDSRVRPARPDLVRTAVVPDYALGPHTASLGLAFSHAGVLPPALQQGAFVGQHGSWNRVPISGYRVIFVPFDRGVPASGDPIDVLTGFIDPNGNALGRPVGVALDRQGALLVADDVGNAVWRVRGANR